jgi:nucleoside-diphosphate-sugar epimerase
MILVTGAAGVIGRAVLRRLAEDGITAFGVHREEFDIATSNSLLDFVPGRPTAVIHLAAAVPHSPRYPDTDASAALTQAIDQAVLKAGMAWGARVVYASSCLLYDRAVRDVKTEDSPLSLESKGPYARAKSAGEALFSRLPSYAVLRVSAPIGPGLPSGVVARLFLDQALAGKPLQVWGTGEREQNYVDVRDIADAFIRAAKAQTSGVFNVSADKPTTMYELAEATIAAVGAGSILAATSHDPLEPEFARYANQRARVTLDWVPRYSLSESLLAALRTTQ